MMRSLWAEIRQPYPIRLYQLIAILVAITGTWAAGIIGVVAYVGDRDELLCRRQAEVVDVMSASFVTVFDAIEGVDPVPAITEARQALAEGFDDLRPAGC